MQRIQHLESMLKHNGSEAAMTPGPSGSDDHCSPQNGSSGSRMESHEAARSPQSTRSNRTLGHRSTDDSNVLRPRPAKVQKSRRQSKALVRQLHPQPVRFDMASGRLRFFGPTTTMHVLSDFRQTPDPAERQQSHWPISMVIHDLSPETHDYLMNLFWDCHNSVMHMVHKYAFYEDLDNGDGKFYSLFLHLTLLAVGFRYADKDRSDIRKIALSGPVPSIFHMKARKMAEFELMKPGGLPSIQALLLLGDLEAGCGRDDTGWMYSGMAFRLVYDVGLHVDFSILKLTEIESQIRYMVLWAALLCDKYWALFLGRPTILKEADIAPSSLQKDFRKMIDCGPNASTEKTVATKIYENHLKLMDLVGTLCETFDSRKNGKLSETYLDIATLDRDLNSWYSDLADELKWTPMNIAQATPSFFLLQYVISRRFWCHADLHV